MEGNGQILLRYSDETGNITEAANVNGSVGSIAGIMSADGNVFGLMPHPEAAAEVLLGSTDGLLIFRGMTEIIEPNRARSADSGLLNIGSV
jgi:phosphoribosylformylglycinamidine synthase